MLKYSRRSPPSWLAIGISTFAIVINGIAIGRALTLGDYGAAGLQSIALLFAAFGLWAINMLDERREQWAESDRVRAATDRAILQKVEEAGGVELHRIADADEIKH